MGNACGIPLIAQTIAGEQSMLEDALTFQPTENASWLHFGAVGRGLSFTEIRFRYGRAFLLLLVAFAFMAGALSAMAETVRLPKSGDPAFSVDVPEGWTTLYDQYANLRITATDRTCFIQLSIITGADVKRPLPEVAAEILSSAGATPFSKTEPAAIAGRPATMYVTTLTNPSGLVLDLKLMLAKLDSAHVASLVVVTGPQVSTDRAAALEVLIGRVRLTGAK